MDLVAEPGPPDGVRGGHQRPDVHIAPQIRKHGRGFQSLQVALEDAIGDHRRIHCRIHGRRR
jgi:hypothetical protein